MDARTTLARRALQLAYATSPLPGRRTRPSQTPGWLFDLAVVAVLLVVAVGYFIS